MRSLVARWPALAAVPVFPLADLPTPVVRASALSAALGTEIWIKRDDLTAARYGGNKVRKLELLLGVARARGAKSIVTMGALGSHHVLATGLYAREAGLRVLAPLMRQPMTDHVRANLRATLAAGVEVVPVSGIAGAFASGLALAARALREDGVRPLFVVFGGSNATGTIGYVDAGAELAAQVERGELPAPDRVFVALGSGGTAAGALAGMRLAGLPAELHAVVVAEGGAFGAARVRWLARGALAELRKVAPELPRPELSGLVIDRAELGRGYGHETASAAEAIQLAASLEGLTLEPTYTGKTLAALVREARGALRGRRLLYWHTLSATPAGALDLPAPPPGHVPADLAALLGPAI